MPTRDRKAFFIGEAGFNEFATFIGLSDSETEARAEALSRSYMPFRVTSHYADLIRNARGNDRNELLNIVLPPAGKGAFEGRFDPYGNLVYSDDAHAFLQNKYPKTLLVHMTDYCSAHCQFCYKVSEIRVSHASAAAEEKKIDATLRFLDANPAIDNILFTGGDPGSIKPQKLARYIRRLIDHPSIRVLRFATKSIVFEPSILANPELCQLFAEIHRNIGKQVTVIAQINHPAEFSAETAETLRTLRRADVLVRGQPAVVKGVNDKADVLSRLMRAFNDHRIVAYYFTLFMPVRGVEQYGVPIHDGHAAFQLASGNVNGLEKKGVLLISHDFGKVEVVGFSEPGADDRKIILRWHEVAAPKYLPPGLLEAIPHHMGDVFELHYPPGGAYSFDQLLQFNGLPSMLSTTKLAAESIVRLCGDVRLFVTYF